MFSVPSHLREVFGRAGTVVVPSRQRAHALRLAYAAEQLAQGKRVWATPDALPLDSWLAREVERHAAGNRLPRLLSSAEEWLLWRQCTVEATADLALVNGSALAQSLRRADRLATELGIDPQALRGGVGSECELFLTVQRAVAERCRALDAWPAAALLPRLSCPGDDPPLAFAGFLAPSPQRRAMIAARAGRGYETTHPLPTQLSPLAHPRLVDPADEVEELDRMAEWCRERLAAQPDARVLILLPGSAGRRERLARLICQAVDPGASLAPRTERAADANLAIIEGGGPLAESPAVSHALTSLSLLSGEALALERLTEWLRAPWWTGPSAEWRARLDLSLRERGGLELDVHSLREALRRAPPALSAPARLITTRLEHALESLRSDIATPREWSERFRAALEQLGWPGTETRSSPEQQTVVRFHELLDELGQLSAAARTLSRHVAVQWLTELANHTPFRPADDDACVTISGTLADPVVRYDAVWVGGLHAEVFPQPAQPDPFLPLAAQLSSGWPAACAASRLDEAHALLTAWRAACRELVLSAPARAEDIDLLPSPLLEEWRGGEPAVPEPRAALWLPLRLHRPGLLEEWRDDVGVAWSLEQPLPGGTRSLELQNQCPFRAYAELRLGSAELGEAAPGLAPEARGQLLHLALQRFWERLRDSRALAAMADDALQALIRDCLDSAAGAIAAGDAEALTQSAWARERRRTARLLRALCEIERGRAHFRVEHTEHVSRLRLAGGELTVRIDRVDALESGGLAILDYKSGKRISADWYGERPSHPQLLAYLAALGEPVVAIATVNVTAREVGFDGIAACAGLLPDVGPVKGPQGDSQGAWQLRVQEWRGCIERLACGFAAGRAEVDPKPHACDFCHAASICRIGDHVADVPEGNDAPGAGDD